MPSPPPYIDVDGDRWSNPGDVLLIINYLNDRTSAEGEPTPLLESNLDVTWDDLDELLDVLVLGRHQERG